MSLFRPKAMSADVRELLRGTSFAAAHQFAGMAAAFLVSIVLARLLGVTGLGVYTLSATTITIAALVGRVGLDMAMVRFASVGAHQDDWRVVTGVYRAGMQIALFASGGVTIVLMFLAPLFARHVFDNPAVTEPTRIMALTILPSTIALLHGEMLKALKLTGTAGIVQSSAPPLVNLIILGIAALSIKGGLTPEQAAWIAFGSAIVVSAIAVWLWRRLTPQIKDLRDSFEMRRLLKTSLPLLWVASMGLIVSVTDVVMLGIWTTAEDVAIYSAALRLVALVGFPLMAVNAIAIPQLSGLYANNDIERLESVTRGATLVTGILALLISAVYWVKPDVALGFFGPEFTVASHALVILTAGRFVHTATGPVGILLIVTGREKLLQHFITASAVANIALNALLIPQYGIEGAAIASALCLAGVKLAIMYFVNQRLEIGTVPFSSIRNRRP